MTSENGTTAPSKVLPLKRPSLASKLSSIIQAIYASITPPAKYPYSPGNVDNTPQTGILEDIRKLGFEDYCTLLAFLNASITGVTDDKDLLLEGLVGLLSKLPAHSKEMKELTDGFINQLWTDLDHPPVSSLGGQYKYREADGSYNNIHTPTLGAANTPYARTVPPMTFQNPELPDPSAIFDSLMARGDEFEPHPNGISSMLFYLATIIIHDIFQTSPDDHNVNLTSSYLDLAPLYGRNIEEQKTMRTFKDGLLKPDCFSSKRILGFPPGCSVFLVMFNRFHNYVVTQLAIINESGRFSKPNSKLSGKASEEAWAKYDNDLFQTGRLITCGLYANIILKDYVRTILSLNRSGATWSLDPRTHEGKNIFSKGVPEGVGNQVSAEFNLIYRWHSAISRRDEQWTIEEFKRIMPNKDPSTASMVDVMRALRTFENGVSINPENRAFSNLQRKPDGTFDDDDLVKILRESIEDVAGSFGANKVPNCLKTIEVLGIFQARYWNVATLNEFRSFMGLTKYKAFEEINPNPDIAKKLRQFYDSPDFVELYPGLVAEKPKPPMTPGSGLCVNYTTSRAILSDAVALVRGDRFYTIDYTPKNITNWGYNEANFDVSVNQGHVMHKLIFRSFPKHFAHNSIYAHFPFVIPSENQKILDSLGTSGQYSWEAPKRHGELVMIKSHKAITSILNNKKDFKVTWGPAIEFLTNSESGQTMAKNFCLAHDEDANTKNRQYITKALYHGGRWHQDIASFYATTANRLIEQYSYEFKTKTIKVREVDVVRDVIALANTHFMSALFDLPIKTDINPHGIYSEQQMYLVLVATFACIFFDADIASSFKLHSTARELAQQLGSLVLLNAKVIAKGGLLEGLIDTFKTTLNGLHSNGHANEKWPSLKFFGDHMIERMLGGGKTVDEVVWGSIMPLTAAGVANQTQNLSQAVEYYLGDGKEHLPDLYRLSHERSKEADEILMKYMLEGCRLRATVAVYRDLATEQTITDYNPSLRNPKDLQELNPLPDPDPSKSARTFRLPAGTRVVLDLIAASHDAAAFPEPEKVRLDRPIDSYMHYGWGPHECLGRQASQVGLTALFKSIMALKNLRRGDGPQGEIKSFPIAPWNGQIGDRNVDPGWTGLRTYMTADQSGYWPLPSTLKVRWDA